MNETILHHVMNALEDIQVGDYETAERRLEHLIELMTTIQYTAE